MIPQIFGLSLVFFLGFYFFLGNPYAAARGLQKNWAWSKEAKLGMFSDPRFPFEPEKKLNGYKTKTEYVRIPDGTEIPISDTDRIEYPLSSKGYWAYRKIGSTAEFFSESGELLWTKEYRSYPKTHPNGNLILFLSGDNNQVLIADINGNETGAKKLDGRFLTDISFASNGESSVLFSGGELFLLSGKGELLFKDSVEEKEPVFAKSLAISSNGNVLAVHFLKGNRDNIRIYDRNGKKKEEWNLNRVYPHKLYLAVSPEGEVLAGLPEALVLFSRNGKPLLEKKRSKSNSVYQTVFHSGAWFAGEAEGVLYFMDEKGNLLKEERIRSADKPLRFFSAEESRSAFLESGKEILLYREWTR